MPAPRRRNSTRDRETAELRALRVLVRELEAHAARLTTQPSKSRFMPGVWQRMAERQAVATHKAQRENSTLLSEVQRRADWIERLWILLQEMPMGERLVEEKRLATRAADAAVVGRLRRKNLQAASWETALLAMKALDLRVDDAQDRWARETDNDCVRLGAVRHLPFDLHTTAGVMWKALTDSGCMTSASESPWLNPVVLDRSHTMCAVKFAMKKPPFVGGESLSLKYHAVIEGQSEEKMPTDDLGGRILFTWHSASSVVSREMTIDAASDTMWVAILPSPDSGLACTVAVVSLTSVNSSPMWNGVDSKKLLDVVGSAVEKCVTEFLAASENMLMDGGVNRSPEPCIDTEQQV